MKKNVDQAWFDQNWFSKLIPQHKLAWLYIWTKSDLVGAWEPNFELADFQLGHKIKWMEFLEAVKDRVKVLSNGKWWITEYCQFQFGTFSEKSRVHQAALRLLWNHGVSQKDTLWIPYPYPMDSLIVTSHSQSLPEEEVKEKKPKPPKWAPEEISQARELVGRLFGRKPSTKWSEKEEKSLLSAMPVTEDDMAIITDYYTAERRKNGEGIHRRDLLTFLNNYPGELDRARSKRRFQPACDV